jgi:hypothetical protein
VTVPGRLKRETAIRRLAEQLGHTDPAFSLRVYTQAVKRRQRLEGTELAEFTRAIEWAEWALTGTKSR